MPDRPVIFILNGKETVVLAPAHRRLLDLLRIGECGACTVLMDGKAVNACLVLVGQLEGSEIITTEHLASDGWLNELQQNFLDSGAVQCGFCTPGMLLSATALLEENPDPNEEEIREAIAGNLCRCTGYKQIIEAIQKTANQNLKAKKSGKKTVHG
jgi:aerobic-type carbon monoxide dehydrogenase small subunit (CoxS/CutS family)